MKVNYKCRWCGEEFVRDVDYQGVMINPATKKGNPNQGKGHAGSTMVRCPQCINLIPTWCKEMTGNIVGRKHIHLRSAA